MIGFQQEREAVEAKGLSESVLRSLGARLSDDSVVRFNFPMAKKTTLRVGGAADMYVEPATEGDLAVLLRECAQRRIPVFMLGRGSNLVVRDKGIRGVVISLSRGDFQALRFEGEWVTGGAGVRLKTLAMSSRKYGVTGFEFLEGIPGTIGGALRMNAGAMGASFFDQVERVRYMDGEGIVRELAGSEVPVSYRSCELFRECVALGAVLRGERATEEEISARLTASSEHRWKSQPAASSAGCMFKNPPEIPAGKLIEELGLKGMERGGAMISTVHGNFIVNARRATAEDVLGLIGYAQRVAYEKRGIELETEVEIVGEA